MKAINADHLGEYCECEIDFECEYCKERKANIKDFCEMTADEIRDYKGQLFNYSLQCRSNVNPSHIIPFDGSHTTYKGRENAIQTITGKWRLISDIRRTETVR